jgi:hypothetical protein
MVLSIPRAATAMPYIAAKLKLTKMLTAMAKIGMITDLYPRARPNITLVAAPVLQESATSCTGLQLRNFVGKYMKVKSKKNHCNVNNLIPVCIASIILCNKSNNKSSPKTNTHTQEELPVSTIDVNSCISRMIYNFTYLHLGEPINEI